MNREGRFILKEVCETLKIEQWKVLSKSRKREYVDARFLAVYFIKEKLGNKITLYEIGFYFGRIGLNAANCFGVNAIHKTKEYKAVKGRFQEKYVKCKEALGMYSEFCFDNVIQF